MHHVFVETNWLVDYAAPPHRQMPAAVGLLDRARKGELQLHIPALCIGEAKRTLRTKFQARGAADAVRHFVRWAVPEGSLAETDRVTVLKALDVFERNVGRHLDHLDDLFQSLRAEPCVDIFSLSERCLELLVDIGFSLDLKTFDQSVLAAVLGRAEKILKDDSSAQLSFCEADSDLWPRDKHNNPRPELSTHYECRGIWVYGDFDMEKPVRPAPWPP